MSKGRTQSRFSFRVRTLGAAVPLGGPHKGGRTRDAQEGKLLLEGVGPVLAPVIVPNGETARDLLGESAEAAAHALADRLERLKAGGPARGVDADTLSRAVVDGHKHRDLSLAGEGGGQVGAHIVSTVSGMIVPSCVRGPRGAPTRAGASRLFARMSRRTRRLDVRTPAPRSRAQTFRCPSP